MKLDVENVIRYYIMENKFMKLALKEANKALLIDEVPVGCVIVYNDKVIARGYNKREKLNNVLAHAEAIAIDKACKKIKSWRLEDCDIYVTLEPCIMCIGAMMQARIRNLYFGAYDKKMGAAVSHVNISEYSFNHTINIEGGILDKECGTIISDFFAKLRVKKNQ